MSENTESNKKENPRSWAVTMTADTTTHDRPYRPSPALGGTYISPLARYTSMQRSFESTEDPEESYDTDLEDDFPRDCSSDKPIDPTGEWVYRQECKKRSQVPVSYVTRRLGESCLRIRYHYLGPSGMKPLAEALKENTILDTLDISDNFLSEEGGISLGKVLTENTFITSLDLSMNFVKTKGCRAICEMLETNTSLKSLSLSHNSLSDTDAEQLGAALQSNVSLESLDLSYNKFTDAGGKHLAQGLAKNIGLLDLDLSWNSIRQDGAVAVCKALQKNDMLEILDLSWNGLGSAGATALGRALVKNGKLKVLDISNNRFGPESAKVLSRGIGRNKSLETLLLGINPFGDAGVTSLIQAIIKCTSIKLFAIESVVMTEENDGLLRQLAEERDIITLSDKPGACQTIQIENRVLEVFDKFIGENESSLEDLFHSLDKDQSGDVTMEELRHGLKGAGLRLTNKLLTFLLDEIDEDKSGTIEYHELMEGRLQRARKIKHAQRAHEEALDELTADSREHLNTSTESLSPAPHVTASTAQRPLTEGKPQTIEIGNSNGPKNGRPATQS